MGNSILDWIGTNITPTKWHIDLQERTFSIKNVGRKKAELSNKYISDKFTYNSQSRNRDELKKKDKLNTFKK